MKENFIELTKISDLYVIPNKDGSALAVYHRYEDKSIVLEFYEDENDVEQAYEGDKVMHLSINDVEELMKVFRKLKKEENW